MDNIKKMLKELSNEISKILVEPYQEMTSYDINAFKQIIQYLDYMLLECETNQFKPKSIRYPYITRIVVELPPSVLNPELGGRLIEVEKIYIEQP